MPPIEHPQYQPPRVVLYHQTHYHRNNFVSLLPLLTEAVDLVPVTHLIIAAIHLNDPPGHIHLNDDPPDSSKYASLWEEVAIMQDIGVKVLGMLGGAAQGSFQRLDRSDGEFEAYYVPLREMVRRHNLDGLDLDVEEQMSLNGIVRLIDRLKADFGPEFLITLAPVATALRTCISELFLPLIPEQEENFYARDVLHFIPLLRISNADFVVCAEGRPHLSGFDYEALEIMRGSSIAWYNTQFYNNWGRLESFIDYDAILRQGWRPERVVVGALTSPGNGNGFVNTEELQRTVTALSQFYTNFGGVMGWEYFNSQPGGEGRPWMWAVGMMASVRGR